MVHLILAFPGLSRPRRRTSSRRSFTFEPLESRVQLSTLTPDSVTLGADSLLAQSLTQTVAMSITLPQESSYSKVDIALLLDNTGSFSTFSGKVSNLFNDLVSSLTQAMPGVDFGFGVARFEDYGGAGREFSGGFRPGRPFTLNQPIVTQATAAASGSSVGGLIHSALDRPAGFGGDGPESAIEALYQIATGAGFDGDGNGSTLDSGPAGAQATQTSPGISGDVPAFSSNVALASGTLGGIGWRPDAQHIVLLATDFATAAAFSGDRIPATIQGDGQSIPSTAFASVDDRFGFVSSDLAGPGTGPQPAVAPRGAATVQETINALNALDIKVIGMGPGASATFDVAASSAPSTYLSALGRLTGATDEQTGSPLVFSTEMSAEALTQTIVDSVKTVAAQPIQIRLTATDLPEGITFNALPVVSPDVGPGVTTAFDVTLTRTLGSALDGVFHANYVDASSGAILGIVPFRFSLPGMVLTGDATEEPPPLTDSNSPTSAPTISAVRRAGVHRQPTTILVTFSGPMDAASVENTANYELRGPAGRGLKLRSASYDAATFTVTLHPQRRVYFYLPYSLRINGEGAQGITSAAKVNLAGTDGQAGTSSTVILRYGNVKTATSLGNSVPIPPRTIHRAVMR